MIEASSLFTSLTASVETFTPLFERAGVKVERIDSFGQASPEGFWYDQSQDEWVVLIRGDATLELEGQPPLLLKAGDHVIIPSHVKHRVAKTSMDALWVAVHMDGSGAETAMAAR